MKVLLLITGASRGLGRSIAKAFCQGYAKDDIHAVLIARRSLDETEQIIASTNVKVSKHRVDLSRLDSLEQEVDRIFMGIKVADYDRHFLINNAGTLGHIGPTSATPNLEHMRRSIDFNVTSSLWISTRFAKLMSDSTAATIVNISSLVAVHAFPTMGIYSAGKAARDSYHQAMAKESQTNLRILNYAPGPLETELSTELRTADGLSSDLKLQFQQTLIDPDVSARVLVKLLQDDTYESGAHIDYYDLL
jgi:sepiapterin reductase